MITANLEGEPLRSRFSGRLNGRSGMTNLSRLIGAAIAGVLIGFPGPLLAQARCVLTSEAELSNYVNLLVEEAGTDDGIVLVEGDRDTPENAFTRGAIAVRSGDLFISVQFDRDGVVTDFDVQRRTGAPVDEVVVYLLDDCLDPYEEIFAPLTSLIEKQVKAQIAQEEERKAKLGL
jgi:hypothetical protein